MKTTQIKNLAGVLLLAVAGASAPAQPVITSFSQNGLLICTNLEPVLADPRGPLSGSSRMIRGGFWDSGASYCRSASRGTRGPTTRDSGVGFRVVLASGQP